jgi:hypothetical protein
MEAAGDEPTEDWLTGLSKEAEADLERRLLDAFTAWAKEHKETPTFYGVTDFTQHEAPEIAE